MQPLLSIIVPVYNESATIAAVLERLLTIELPLSREIIAVNDGSKDGTVAALDAAAARSPLISVIHHERNGGKGMALRTGLRRTNGSIVAVQDADLELDPAQLASLVEPVLRGDADAVYGSRFMHEAPHVPLMTRFGNATLTQFTNLLYGSALTDMETCYKIMRGDLARSLPLVSNGFEIEPEITVQLLKRGARIVELPVTFSPRSRAAGKKIRWRDGWHALDILVRHKFSGVE